MRARLACFLAALLLLPLAGCGSMARSDAAIRERTSAYLGAPVTSYERRYDDMSNTYYRVQTPRGRFNCLANGTVVLATVSCERM